MGRAEWGLAFRARSDPPKPAAGPESSAGRGHKARSVIGKENLPRRKVDDEAHHRAGDHQTTRRRCSARPDEKRHKGGDPGAHPPDRQPPAGSTGRLLWGATRDGLNPKNETRRIDALPLNGGRPSPSIAADLRTHMAAPGRRKRGNRTLTQFTRPGSAKSEAEKKGPILPASLQAIEDCVFSPCLTEGVHSIYLRSSAFIRGQCV